jgi:hypothetical protein
MQIYCNICCSHVNLNFKSLTETQKTIFSIQIPPS